MTQQGRPLFFLFQEKATTGLHTKQRDSHSSSAPLSYTQQQNHVLDWCSEAITLAASHAEAGQTKAAC